MEFRLRYPVAVNKSLNLLLFKKFFCEALPCCAQQEAYVLIILFAAKLDEGR